MKINKYKLSLKKSFKDRKSKILENKHRIRVISKYLLILYLVLFSFSLRVWNLNTAGRTWDEFAYIHSGYSFIELIRHGNFSDRSWYEIADHPPIARYFYGIASYLDHIPVPSSSLKWYYKYDWQYSRLVSACFFSLTVVFVALLGFEVSMFIGVIAGIIFSMLPISVGLSQLVTLESPLTFFFTGTIYFFIQLLKKNSIPKVFITGIFLGLAIGVKLTNLLLVPLMPLLYLGWNFINRTKLEKKQLKNKKILLFLLLIYILALIVFIIAWPGMWLHAPDIFHKTMAERFPHGDTRINELFLGKNIPVPYSYFFIYFLLTTPLAVLTFFILGIRRIIIMKEQVGYTLIIWFIFPFIQSFYNSINGIRYIIEIYAPLSILSAIGFDFLVSKISQKTFIKSVLFLPIFVYLLFTLIQISPYYLSYFNSIAGGTKGVYANRLFPLGWWGEGQRNAGNYISRHSFGNMRIGLAVIPKFVFPPVSSKNYSIEYLENAKDAKKALINNRYDYVVVNYLFLIRTEFNENLLDKDYSLVHSALADGAPIVNVYRHK